MFSKLTTILSLLTVASCGRSLERDGPPDVVCRESQDGFAVFLPHPTDCGLFYLCVGLNPVLMACPPGLHFDPSLDVCNWPQNVKCNLRLDYSRSLFPFSSGPSATTSSTPTTSNPTTTTSTTTTTTSTTSTTTTTTTTITQTTTTSRTPTTRTTTTTTTTPTTTTTTTTTTTATTTTTGGFSPGSSPTIM